MSVDLPATYRAAFGQEPDRQFQMDVAAEMADSGRLVLRAPTGSGKTRAALLAPLAAWRVGRPLADRIIYAVPLRSLANSLASEARDAVSRLGLPLRVTVQMGGAEEDPLYERGHIVFTTIDQMLSRYLSLPYSLGSGRSNMCPGAFIGAYIVIDEIHLLDRARAFSTTLVMLGQHFRNLARFLVMSATLSDTAVAKLALALRCSSRCVTAQESAQWRGFADIERAVEPDPRPLSADAITARHSTLPSRMLVVANTVARSQQLFSDLRSRLDGQADVHLLHSQYLPSDRAEREAVLGRLFGKTSGTTDRPRVLVATQVIEVGIDISCDVMHTELAPASSLVQRLGRCARWPGERGQAVVHAPSVDERGEWRLGPYRDHLDSVTSTWRYLLENTASAPLRLTPSAADAFVDSVHGGEDAAFFARLVMDQTERRVAEAIDDGEIARRRELIRNVDNISVLVSSDMPPPAVQIAEWIGVPRTSMYGVADGTPAWVYEVERGQSGEGAWVKRPLDRAVVSGAFLLALSPDRASYDDTVGLRLGLPGAATPVHTRQASERPRFGYMRESYLLHTVRVLRVGLALEQTSYIVPDSDESRPGMAVAIETLDEVVGAHGVSARLCRLAAALHDVGKLSRCWQDWAASWQRRVSGERITELLAHTDFDPLLHRDMDTAMIRSGHIRPPHAVASALASESIAQNAVVQMCPDLDANKQQNLSDAVLSAVGRHHAPLARADCSFDPAPGADDMLERTLAQAGVPIPDGGFSLLRIDDGQLGRFADIVVRLAEDGQRGGKDQARITMAVYWLVVRYLRTSDGHSQALARVDEC